MLVADPSGLHLMLPLRFIREQVDLVRASLAARGDDAPLDELLELDEERRRLLQEIETRRAELNRRSKEIGRTQDAEERRGLIEATRGLSAELDGLLPDLKAVQTKIDELLLLLPAIPHESVPRGDSADDNPLLYTRGERPAFDFEPRPHWEIGERLGILDLPRAAKIAGSGFWLFKGAGARLQRALIGWMLDFHVREHGYRELYPPALVTTEGMTLAGKLPKFAEDSYRTEPDGLWLNPTAEVPLAVMHSNEVLDGALLPAKYVAYTPAFRREAGAAGIDTRGLRRVHQFDKVELFSFSDPERSYDDLETMREAAEATVRALGLPYRVRELCTADLGFSASKTYDIEIWASGVQDWLEVSSISNCEAFQSRRAGTRFRRPGEDRTQYVHTLNGSALALPRTVIAILENYQRADGSVEIPEPLRAYLGGLDTLEAEPAWP